MTGVQTNSEHAYLGPCHQSFEALCSQITYCAPFKFVVTWGTKPADDRVVYMDSSISNINH